MKTVAYLSLGSNIGDREANLRAAISRLNELLGDVTAVSGLYETEPVEVVDQPWFINCAVALATDLSAEELLAGVLTIERSMGRERTRPKGPRNIDIDILLFGDAVVDSPALTIPHPGLATRQFVLAPLSEIAPEAVHPITLKSVRQMRDQIEPGAPVIRQK
jgi:2-amino-4-hydroxy-6-hydroxymethyldihydropteridine diphosphokinase